MIPISLGSGNSSDIYLARISSTPGFTEASAEGSLTHRRNLPKEPGGESGRLARFSAESERKVVDMQLTRYLSLWARILIVVGVGLALADFDWRLPIALLVAGFGLWAMAFYVQRTPSEECYEDVVAKHRLSHESREAPPAVFSGWVIAAFVASFLAFCGLSIYLNVFWPMLIWFPGAVGLGLLAQKKHQAQLDQVWQAFAEEMDWDFEPGNMFVKGSGSCLRGEKAGRRFEISYHWSTRLSNHRRQLTFGRTWTSEEVGDELDFYLVRAAIESDPEDVAKELQQSSLFKDDLKALASGSISLLSGQIEFVIDRSPRRPMELRYYLDLLERLAHALEQLAKERREKLSEQLRSL